MADQTPADDKKGILDKLIGYLLGNDKQEFLEVHIDAILIDEIINIAIESHPNEFIALLEGKIEKKAPSEDPEGSVRLSQPGSGEATRNTEDVIPRAASPT